MNSRQRRSNAQLPNDLPPRDLTLLRFIPPLLLAFIALAVCIAVIWIRIALSR